VIALTVADLVAATGGVAHGVESASLVTGVSLDSRTTAPGDIFVAIVGETHDAHDHVAQALARGAVLAMVSRPIDGPILQVEDTVRGLGAVARASLDRLPNCRVIAITGSSGKTSTKDIIAQVLAQVAVTVAPEGSFNNEIGLPSTVLKADETTRFLVMEMGMRGHGHIEYLCAIAPPSVGVVTNVGTAHVELLGSQDAIALAKSELVQALPSEGVAILNHDDPRVDAMRSATPARVLTYGESEGSDVQAVEVVLDDLARARFTLVHAEARADVHLNLHGRHQVWNALAAAAVLVSVGISVAEAARMLGEVGRASRWRMEVDRTSSGTVIVNDAYNANPESMRAALEALVVMSRPPNDTNDTNDASERVKRRSWAVLGEMRELGSASEGAHRELGRLVADLGIDRLVAVGDGTLPLHQAALEAMGPGRVQWVPDVDGAVALLGAALAPDDIALIKASRSIGLERVAHALLGPSSDKDGEP